VNQRRSTCVPSVIKVRECSSQTKTILVKVPIEDVEEDGLEVDMHQQDNNSDASNEECEFNGCIELAVTELTPSYDRA